jgi:arylamine N-acetyltransferase
VPADVDQGYYLQMWNNRSATVGGWHDLYYFTLAAFGPMDFACANFFTSLFPQSLFLKVSE